MARRERNVFEIEDKELMDVENSIRMKKACAAMWFHNAQPTLTTVEEAVCNMHTATRYMRKEHILAIVEYLLQRHNVVVTKRTDDELIVYATTFSGCRQYRLVINKTIAVLDTNYNGRVSVEFHQNLPVETGIEVFNSTECFTPEGDIIYKHYDVFEIVETDVLRLVEEIAKLTKNYIEYPTKKLPPRKKRV